jgi:hypothetical protein
MHGEIQLAKTKENDFGRAYEGLCRTCGSRLGGDISYMSHRVFVSLPSHCPAKDDCQREVGHLMGVGIIPDEVPVVGTTEPLQGDDSE